MTATQERLVTAVHPLAPRAEEGPRVSRDDLDNAQLGSQFGGGSAYYVKTAEDQWYHWRNDTATSDGEWDTDGMLAYIRDHGLRDITAYRWDNYRPTCTITEYPEARALPVGSIIRITDPGNYIFDGVWRLREKIATDPAYGDRWDKVNGTETSRNSLILTGSNSAVVLFEPVIEPEIETSEPTDLIVGNLMTLDQVRRLPVGSRLNYNGGPAGVVWQKIAENHWESVFETGGGYGDRDHWGDANLTTRVLLRVGNGEVAEPGLPVVGDDIRISDHPDLPIGTRVHYTGRDRAWQKIGFNQWIVWNTLDDTRRGSGVIQGDRALGTRRLTRLGEGEPVVEQPHPYCIDDEAGRNHPSRETFALLPIGTQMDYEDQAWTKTAVDQWTCEDDEIESDDWWSSPGVITFLPDEAPLATPPTFTVGQLMSYHSHRELFPQLPVGTVIAASEHRYTKVRADHWTVSSSTRTMRDDQFNSSLNVIHSLPGATPARLTVTDDPDVIARRVEEAKDEIRAAVNECVQEQGNWGWVRDGAWMLLGIDPMPAVGDTVEWGKAFGLPVGTVFRHGSNLYTIERNEEPYPALLRGTAVTMSRYAVLEILWRGEYTEPVYTGRNNLIHQVWVKERELRQTHNWCHAVENCLENHGLDDPGDTPDEPAAPEFVRLEVGEVAFLLDHSERFALMPNGTTFTTHTGALVVKADNRFVTVSDLRTIASNMQLTVVNIPAPVEDDIEF